MANEIDLYSPGEVGPANELTPSFDNVAPAPDLPDGLYGPLTEPDLVYDREALQGFLDGLDDVPVGQAVEFQGGIHIGGGRVVRVFGMSGPHPADVKPGAKPARKSAMGKLLARAKK